MQVDGHTPAAADERAIVEAAIRDGRVRFLGIELLVARGALVPRPETELLARLAIASLAGAAPETPRVIDMCCGAGNLACSIAHCVPRARVWAADLTAACADLARRNVEHVGVSSRVSVHQGDLFSGVAGLGLEGTIDLIVCNPPYISEKRLSEERTDLLELEPQEAFAAGPYGLSIHQRVIRDAVTYLRPGALLCVEIGVGQRKQVELLFQRTRSYDPPAAECDSSGTPRVVFARRRAAPQAPLMEN